MKKLLLIILFLGAYNISAQTEPQVCISQTAANKCATVAAELIEARKVIAEAVLERQLSTVERERAEKVIAGLNELAVVNNKVIASYEKVTSLYKEVIELQQKIILDLEKRLAKPKSAFSKFLTTLKEIGLILAGVIVGRGL